MKPEEKLLRAIHDSATESKAHESEIVTRSAPQWAWDIIDETLACDAESNAFDRALRLEIKKAMEAMEIQDS